MFQVREFPVHCHDQPLQFRHWHHKADTMDAVTLLERKGYSRFFVCSDAIASMNAIDDERKGR
jgi:hypothetical protein